MVTQVGNQTFGIVVDGVFHTEEIVVKPMSTELRHIPMFSGNTILGDGSVIMIIDPNGIAQAVGAVSTAQAAAERDRGAKRGVDADEKRPRCWSSAPAPPQPKAVPLSLVTRLEEIDAKKIEISNGRPLVQYRGQLMPLVRVNERRPVQAPRARSRCWCSPTSGRSMGLVVDEIVDIVEDRLNIEVPSDTPGVLGSAVIKGQATEIIDIGHFLPLAFEDWLRRKEMNDARRARARCCSSTTPPSSATCSPRCSRPRATQSPRSGGAEDALELLKEGQRSTSIVTDIEMPGMNGFELAEAVRSDPRTAAIADHRAVVDDLARGDRARPRRSASTTTSPSSTARA